MFHFENYGEAQRSEFLNLKQGKMTVTKAIRRFERLEKLRPFCKLDEEERNHEMLERFHPDITIFVEIGGQPTTVARCYERALRA